MTTTENKHTPGPWRVGFDGYTIRQDIGHHGGYYIASTSANYPEMMPENVNRRDKANARLIAAAPELLEALLAMMEIIGPPEDPAWADDDQLDAAWKLSAAAVAKASSSH